MFFFSFFLSRYIDVNECNNSTLNCATLATCTNTIGSYYCTCNIGYGGNGTVCADVNECLGQGTGNNCAPQATCTNTVGSFSCACNTGYNGTGVVCIGLVFLCSCLLSCFSFRNLTQNLKLQTSMSVSWGPMTAVPMLPVLTLLDLLCALAIRAILVLVFCVLVTSFPFLPSFHWLQPTLMSRY